MSVYSNLDPHAWFKDHFHVKPETLEIILGFFILWVALMLFSYAVSLLIYWILSGFKILEEGLYSLLFY